VFNLYSMDEANYMGCRLRALAAGDNMRGLSLCITNTAIQLEWKNKDTLLEAQF